MTRRWVIGDTVVINAFACAVGDRVTFTLLPPDGGAPVELVTCAVGGDRRPVATVSMRATFVGVHDVVVRGEDDDATASATFTVHGGRRRRSRRSIARMLGASAV